VRFAAWLVIGIVCSAAAADGARADKAPVIVIPGRPGVPVMINGFDASYTVVEGDWGLDRPGHMPPAIVSGPLLRPAPYESGPWFPREGRRPGYGRREVEPPRNRRLPPPAPSYYREWGTQSEPSPATIPDDPPPVITTSPSVDDDGSSGNGSTGNGSDQPQDRRHNPRGDDRRRNDHRQTRPRLDHHRHDRDHRHHPRPRPPRRASVNTRRP
jgi:hypothetical protein